MNFKRAYFINDIMKNKRRDFLLKSAAATTVALGASPFASFGNTFSKAMKRNEQYSLPVRSRSQILNVVQSGMVIVCL
jgi:hypothetical protein